MAKLDDLIRDKMSVPPPPGEKGEEVVVVLRPAPWDGSEEAISVPYKRSDDKYARSSPTMPRAWGYAVARAGIDRFFSEEWVASLLARCVKRLSG